MEPTFYSDDWLAITWFSPQRDVQAKPALKINDIVLIERIVQPGVFYIKRISTIQESKDAARELWVESDNPSGTDSRSWGWLNQEEVIGKVLFRYRKANR